MIERYGLRIDDFLGGRCGVSHAGVTLGEIWSLAGSLQTSDVVIPGLVLGTRRKLEWRSRSVRDLLSEIAVRQETSVANRAP